MKVNRKEISSDELKKIQLEALKFLCDFCNEKGIKYFLVGGSLIGAIRHKGFIPWDDDIDIGLLRNDYDKLIDEINALNSSRYRILSYGYSKKYYLPYAKLIDIRTELQEDVFGVCPIGVGIDIFPFDYLDCSYEEASSLLKEVSTIEKLIHYRSMKLSAKRSLLKNLMTIVLRIVFPLPFRCKGRYRIRRLSRIVSNERKDYMACLVGNYADREICDSWCFEEQIDVQFEDLVVKAPIGYNQYLTNIYGDYMKLPPIEQQVTHHSNSAFWKETNYE